MEEIDLFNPDIIILVGGTARDILGKRNIITFGSRVFTVPFPTGWRSKSEKIKAEERYEELGTILRM